MPTGFQKAKRIVFITYLVALHALLLYFVGERFINRFTSITPLDNGLVSDPIGKTPIPTPIPVPEAFADPADVNSNANIDPGTNTSSDPQTVSPNTTSAGLIIPVAGIRPDQLTDTFTDSRSEGRSHDAIDIMASLGTPVIAAADGEIVKFFDSERGGITIYQMTADKKYMIYYGHLQRRADDVSVGMQVQKGRTIGFVGDTGNAGPGNYHLHFSIAIITDPKRFWSGTYINPYPLLKNGQFPQ